MARLKVTPRAIAHGPWIAPGIRSGKNLLNHQIRSLLPIVDPGTTGKVEEGLEELTLRLTRAGEDHRTPLSDEFTRIWKERQPKGLVSRHAEICAAALAFRRERADRELEEGDAEDWRDLIRGFLITPPVLRGLLIRGWSVPPPSVHLRRYASTVAGGLTTLLVTTFWSEILILLWVLLGLLVVLVLVVYRMPKGLKFVDPSGQACRLIDRTENGHYRLEIPRNPYPETVEFDTTGIPLAEIPAWLEGRLEEGLARATAGET